MRSVTMQSKAEKTNQQPNLPTKENKQTEKVLNDVTHSGDIPIYSENTWLIIMGFLTVWHVAAASSRGCATVYFNHNFMSFFKDQIRKETKTSHPYRPRTLWSLWLWCWLTVLRSDVPGKRQGWEQNVALDPTSPYRSIWATWRWRLPNCFAGCVSFKFNTNTT